MALDSLSEFRTDARAWLKLRRAELGIVALIWLAAAVVFYLLASKHVTPRRYQDEFFYWGIAKNLAAGNGVSWRGAPVGLRSFLYPLYISPVFKLSDVVSTQYAMVHALNAIAASAVVFPTFLFARAMASRRLALAAAAFAVCVPAMNYAGVIGTESLGYPICAAAFAAIFLACWTPRPRNALLALAAILLAILVRTQFIVLPGVLVLALALTAAFKGRAGVGGYLRSQRFLIALIAAGLALMALATLFQGERVVGVYSQAFHGAPLSFSQFWFWLRSFTADVWLSCGILPAIATFAMLGARANRRDERIGALLALAISAALVFVLQLSWFSAVNVFHWRENHVFYERYLFYLAPIFFAGFAASVGRVSMRAALGSLVLALVAAAGFSHEVVAIPFSYDAFGLAYLGYLLDAHEGWVQHVALILCLLTLAMGAAYAIALLPERHREVSKYGKALSILLPLFVLLLAQAKAWSYAWLYSEDMLAAQPNPPGFANAVGEGPIGLLAANSQSPVKNFQAEFWNPRIARVYGTLKPPITSGAIYTNGCQFAWAPSGRLLPGGCGPLPRLWYVSAQDLTVHFRDQIRTVYGRGTRTGVLLETAGPPTLLAMTTGVDLDTRRLDAGKLGVWSFLRERGSLRVTAWSRGATATLLPPGGRAVTLSGAKRVTFTLPVAAGEQVTEVAAKGYGAVRISSVALREGRGPWTPVG